LEEQQFCDYPVIKILKSEFTTYPYNMVIILFSSPDKGTPIHVSHRGTPGEFDFKIGEYCEDFDEKQFEIFKGSVNLKNIVE